MTKIDGVDIQGRVGRLTSPNDAGEMFAIRVAGDGLDHCFIKCRCCGEDCTIAQAVFGSVPVRKLDDRRTLVELDSFCSSAHRALSCAEALARMQASGLSTVEDDDE